MELKRVYDHHGRSMTLDVEKQGEYLYAALGPKGIEAFDIANVDNKDFSERSVVSDGAMES